MSSVTFSGTESFSLRARLGRMPWALVFTLIGIAAFGVMVLFSSTSTTPSEADLPLRHAMRFIPALGVLLILALVPLSWWLWLAYPAYAVGVILLLGVHFIGVEGGGAERWLQLGPVRLQPSEFMKLALTLALARYYHNILGQKSGAFLIHLPAIIMLAVPAALVALQPDLGTMLMLAAAGFAIMFWTGFSKTLVLGVVALQLISMPLVHFALPAEKQAEKASWLGLGSVAYYYVLKDYQRARVDALLDPSADPLGKGYQGEQARIAIGSGGVSGKGYLLGSQSQLNYIPEQHTDFIFTAIAEEFGFLGSTLLLAVWGFVLGWGFMIALQGRSLFARLAAGGAVVTVSFYVAFNIGMVTGLLPVVGVPLPLISYGGTAMLTVMACFGLIISAHIHRDEGLPTRGLF